MTGMQSDASATWTKSYRVEWS